LFLSLSRKLSGSRLEFADLRLLHLVLFIVNAVLMISFFRVLHIVGHSNTFYQVVVPGNEDFSRIQDASFRESDGALILLPGDYFSLKSPPAAPPPFTVRTSLGIHDNNGFDIYFAKSEKAKLRFGFNRTDNSMNGLFVESPGGADTRIGGFESPGTGKNLRIELTCTGDKVEALVNERRFVCSIPAEEEWRPVWSITIDHGSTDGILRHSGHVHLAEIRAGGTGEGDTIVSGGGFGGEASLLNMRLLHAPAPCSRSFAVLALAVFFAAAFLVDAVTLLFFRFTAPKVASLNEVFLVVLPVQCAVLLCLAGIFVLPRITALLAFTSITSIRIMGILTVDARGDKPAYEQGGLIYAGLYYLLGVVATVLIWTNLSKVSLSYSLTALTLAPLPASFLLAGAAGHRFGRLLPVTAAALTAGGILTGTPAGRGWFPAAVSLALTTLVFLHLIRSTRFKKFLRIPVGAIALVCFVAAVESGIRTNPFLDREYGLESLVLDTLDPIAEAEFVKGGLKAIREELDPRNRTIRKPPGYRKIICLGSSSTEGAGATDPEKTSFPARLETLLNELHDIETDVINGGLGGARFYTLFRYFERHLILLQPDVLIVYFGNNGDDPNLETFYRKLDTLLENESYLGSDNELWAALQLRPGIRNGITVKLYLAMANLRTWNIVVASAHRFAGYVQYEFSRRIGKNTETPFPAKRVETKYSGPAKLAELCIQAGVDVVLVPEICLNRRPYFNEFKKTAQDYNGEGVYFLSLEEAFPTERKLDFMIDGVHMNDDGYDIIAKEIASFLVEKGLVGGGNP